MNISFSEISTPYHSPSQIAKALTETWAQRELFCPACGRGVTKYPHNRPVADFFCKVCNEDFELKSKENEIGHKVVDGAYGTMITRLKGMQNPSLFLLGYDSREQEVKNLFVIPKHFFTPEIIEKRRPLSDSARRAKWVGCNILLDPVPLSGRIFYIHNGQPESKKEILRKWQKTLFLRESKNADLRGWTLDVMRCIDKLDKTEFTLAEMYGFEPELSARHENNKHVKDKIRQQLQFLRDKGYLEFKGSGKYRVRK